MRNGLNVPTFALKKNRLIQSKPDFDDGNDDHNNDYDADDLYSACSMSIAPYSDPCTMFEYIID